MKSNHSLILNAKTIQNTMYNSRNKFPILDLAGPRSIGKITLLKRRFSDY